jgi:hypothetical protein
LQKNPEKVILSSSPRRKNCEIKENKIPRKTPPFIMGELV